MKKLLVSVTSAILALSILGYCGTTNDDVEAGAPRGYKMISKDEFDDGFIEIYVFQHIETGCYYTYTEKTRSGDFEQMYTSGGSGNTGKPYCK